MSACLYAYMLILTFKLGLCSKLVWNSLQHLYSFDVLEVLAFELWTIFFAHSQSQQVERSGN